MSTTLVRTTIEPTDDDGSGTTGTILNKSWWDNVLDKIDDALLDNVAFSSWTPAWAGSGGQSGQTYSAQSGRYRTEGKIVHFQGRITTTAKGTITGTLEISGLPSASVATHYYGINVHFLSALTTSVVYIGGYIPPGGTVIVLQMLTAAATGYANMAQGDISNTTDIIFSGFYEKA